MFGGDNLEGVGMKVSEMNDEQLEAEFKRRELERLRDRFAAAALMGFCVNSNTLKTRDGTVVNEAAAAYILADKMLEARAKR